MRYLPKRNLPHLLPPYRLPGTAREESSLPDDDAMLRHAQRRAHEQTPEFRHTFRWRSGIEGTNSHFKSDLGAARLRVRGLPSVRFAVTLKALGLNILRCARALAARFLVRITRLYLKKQLVKYKFSVVTSFTVSFTEITGFYLVA